MHRREEMKKVMKRKLLADEGKARKKKARGPQVRFWVFTDNGAAGTKGMDIVPEAWTVLPEGVRYLTWQYERAPDTDQLHLQGYIELLNSHYVSWLHNHISCTACYFERLGTQKQASVYVHKQESRVSGPYSLGIPTEGQGERTDLSQFRDAIVTGATLRDLSENYLPQLARYGRLYDRLKTLYRPNRREGSGPSITLLIGISGTGKTRSVYDLWELDVNFYRIPSIRQSKIWIDGYDGHTKVLLDEFAGASSSLKLTDLLELLDSYPLRLHIKGGFTYFRPKEIMITTNLHPIMWYDWSKRQAQYLALKRRIKKVLIYFKENEEPMVAGDDFWWDPVLDPAPTNIFGKKFIDYPKLLKCIWTSSRNRNVDLGPCNHLMNYCTGKCKEKSNKPWWD